MQNKMMQLEFQIKVGMFSIVRNFLNKCKSNGMQIEFIEYSGVFSRKFEIKGNQADVISIDSTLKKLNNF